MLELDNSVQINEQLHRAVKRSKPDWLDVQNRPTSAMFKDDNGVSVDRDGGREECDIIEFMRTISLPRRVKGIARLSAEACFQAGCDVKPASSDKNPYHANIFLDSSDIHKQNIQALKLARVSEIIFLDDKMEWT